MFSFHKPRVYRSAEGCCICRAKSSSSRFTDSKKYEEDSIRCFDLKQPRHGEICNACVLLVKRYKRLPTGSNRHWGHVVDARAGPGMKSMTKFKKLKEESIQHSSNVSDRTNNQKSLIPEKFSKIFKKNKKKTGKDKTKSQLTTMSSKPWESQSLPLTPESLDSDCDDVQYSPTPIESASLKMRQAIIRRGCSRRKCLPPKKFRNTNVDSVQFFDENLWIKRKSCCGFVFENKQLGAIIMDVQNYLPCIDHRRKPKEIIEKTTVIAAPQAIPIPTHPSVLQQYNSIKTAPYQLPTTTPRNPTTAMKKHHLFFKRQSESFPLGDMKQINNNPPKTDFVLDIKVLPTTIPTSSAVKIAKLNPVDIGLHSNMAHLQSTALKLPAPFEQQHSMHKPCSKSNSFMHKVKTDTGKIVKHSLEKFSTIRLKPSELSDVKHMVKTVDKSFLIKPVATISQDKAKKLAMDMLPACTTGQSVATKFSDNSSDSGFDENLQDRKSVSPMQDDNEKKIMAIPVQTMYLASGVQIQGTPQSLLLTGNEVANKLLQNRAKAQSNRNAMKLAQLVNGGVGTQKMRAIYSQPPEGAIITTSASTSSASPNIIAIPSTSCTSASPSHISKTPTNIILNGPGGSGNILSTSVPSLNQKIILVKTKYNSNINNTQSVCKN